MSSVTEGLKKCFKSQFYININDQSSLTGKICYYSY